MSNKFKNQDALAIVEVLEKVIQLRSTIIDVFQKTGAANTINDLPHSMIPTALLLDITVTYEAMYEQLIEYELIKAGNPKNSPQNLH